MKILVIGGMHGNEPLGPQIVEKLANNPIDQVDGVIANELAYRAKSRFVEQDMNRVFPGVANSGKYELERPQELLRRAKEYDVVLDFHNTHCPNNDCGFVGELAQDHLYAAALLGLKRVIVADYDCINRYAPNCLSVEVSLSSALNDVDTWYERIALLAQQTRLSRPPEGMERYKFIYRMTLDDKEKYRLDQEDLRAFVKVSDILAKKLGVASPAYPIFVNDAYTPYNFGGLLNRID